MWFVTLLVLFFVVICSLAVVNRYFSFKLHKNTFPLTLAVLTVNMVLLLCTAYLLPLDIYYAAKANASAGEYVPPANNGTSGVDSQLYSGILKRNSNAGSDLPVPMHGFRVAWLLVYWVEFVLCWFIMPVLISYCSLKYACSRQRVQEHEGSERSPIWERMVQAIYQNFKFYSLCVLGLIIGIVYLVSSTGHGLNEFKPLLISLSHLYSLSYTLILLSTGLIIFPKSLLSIGRSPTNEVVNKLFVELSKTNDDINDSQLNMLENAERILNSREANNGDIVFNQMLNECKLEVQALLNELELSINHQVSNTLGASSSAITTLTKLNNHYNKFMTHYYNYLYSKTYSNSIIHTLAQSQSSKVFASTSSILSMFNKATILGLGVLSTMLSMAIVFLEITPTKWGHDWIFNGAHWYSLLLEFIIFTYNTMVSLFAMSKFKFNNFHLIPNGRSNPTNALYYSLYSSRLLFPLCFNLMVLIPSKSDSSHDLIKSSFETTLYQNLAVIPLVNFLNKYLPFFFITFTLISYKFDLKQKVLLKILGEEYYYQFFGMMMYEPVSKDNTVGNNDANPNSLIHDESTFNNRSRMDEDYEYSLQDGRYLFERASSNYDLTSNHENSSMDSASHASYL
ncbi:hypothetical protein HG535_0A07520 [Zygotorulaspora mrakii]|uniref:LMBR1 domain-containing protein n=1 Tax=Zygotorulaspora mrakii TaxID=42260 RepID=A0A7H9AWM1_ZYGMR|nr:uncharacterized protein HG535_0A07520 [Zygotorulaspora mrakii]QLG70810.1 hypothetical protein HG535_0A07520 [Zygotorulaspora mrakii]